MLNALWERNVVVTIKNTLFTSQADRRVFESLNASQYFEMEFALWKTFSEVHITNMHALSICTIMCSSLHWNSI